MVEEVDVPLEGALAGSTNQGRSLERVVEVEEKVRRFEDRRTRRVDVVRAMHAQCRVNWFLALLSIVKVENRSVKR